MLLKTLKWFIKMVTIDTFIKKLHLLWSLFVRDNLLLNYFYGKSSME